MTSEIDSDLLDCYHPNQQQVHWLKIHHVDHSRESVRPSQPHIYKHLDHAEADIENSSSSSSSVRYPERELLRQQRLEQYTSDATRSSVPFHTSSSATEEAAVATGLQRGVAKVKSFEKAFKKASNKGL